MDRLKDSMATIDAITEKRRQKAREEAQDMKEAWIRQRVSSYLCKGYPDELINALAINVLLNVIDDLRPLAHALKTGDNLIVGCIVSRIIKTELWEIAEEEWDERS